MSNYYEEHLHSTSLFQVYQTDLPRIRQYLDEEIRFVQKELKPDFRILEVGAGYGRILRELAPSVATAVGVDLSADSIRLAQAYCKDQPNCSFQVMDAFHLDFEEAFDAVICLQNGLSAIKGQPLALIRQCLKVLKKGGRAYFSTYSPRFWDHRLAWFQEQADKGLLGEIDPVQTGDGRIVCRDGFVGIAYTENDLRQLGEATGCPYHMEEVDGSSLFLLVDQLP